MKGCAIYSGSESHLLDHIAPLSSLLSLPLILTDPEIQSLANHYYPEVTTHYWPNLEHRFKDLADQYDTLIQCGYWSPHIKPLFRTLFNKEMSLVFCPHGQSDKGYGAPLLAPYATQDIVLLYGELLKEMLADLDIHPKKTAMIGNYRLAYYQKYRAHLQARAEEEIFTHFNPKNRTILYAPTWNDADSATSFFSSVQNLFHTLPSHWNLIVKVHPLLSERDPVLFYRLQKLEKRNWIIIEKFPPLYPIIEKIDVYLGDYSSVGYDVLPFLKPMFFLTQPHLPARLHACGLSINNNLFETIEKNLNKATNYQDTQKALCARAFAPKASLEIIRPLVEEGRKALLHH